MIRVAIAEDHQSLVDGLTLYLDKSPLFQVVGSVNDGQELIALVEKKNPDVILMDIRMPRLNGIEAVKLLRKQNSDVKILGFSMFDQDEAVHQMMEAGANGYILKKSSLEEVETAISAVYKGKMYIDSSVDYDPAYESEFGKSTLLTKRQREILQLVGEGLTSREIADTLHIGVYTVDTHRKNMARILGLKGSGELLRYAMEVKYDFDSDN